MPTPTASSNSAKTNSASTSEPSRPPRCAPSTKPWPSHLPSPDTLATLGAPCRKESPTGNAAAARPPGSVHGFRHGPRSAPVATVAGSRHRRLAEADPAVVGRHPRVREHAEHRFLQQVHDLPDRSAVGAALGRVGPLLELDRGLALVVDGVPHPEKGGDRVEQPAGAGG